MVLTSEFIPPAEFVYVQSAVIILHFTDLLNTITSAVKTAQCSHTSHLTPVT